MARTNNTQEPAQPIARLQPSRLPIVGSVAKQFDVTSDQWRVLIDQIFPSAKTVEAIGMALAYCKARKLDVFKRPVHIVPMWSTVLGKMVETVWPGIAEIRTTAARTGQYAGIDEVIYGPMVEREFTGEKEIWQNGRSTGTFETVTETVKYPEWASVVVHRMLNGQKHSYHAKVFWEEAYASNGKTGLPNAMWTKRPRGQLDKCVEAAALRKAFPEEVGNDYAAEEMEGRTIDGSAHVAVIDDAPVRPAEIAPPDVPDVPGEEDATEPGEATGGEDDGPLPVFNVDAYLARLGEELSACTTGDEVEDIFDRLDVQVTLGGMEDDEPLKAAFALKLEHMTRVKAEAFPGDLPIETQQAVKLANTP